MLQFAIHVNQNIPNQVNYGKAVSEGFKRHNVSHTLSNSRESKAEIHCFIGPWFAFQHFIDEERALYLDRASWDHPTYTSINWLCKGKKIWNWRIDKPARYHPEIKPWRSADSLIILGDYGEDLSDKIQRSKKAGYKVTVRHHPSEKPTTALLEEALSPHGIAYGGHSSALVTASIQGLAVFCDNPLAPAYPIAGDFGDIVRPDRSGWLKDLSWHNWTEREISNGEAWDHFRKYV